MKREDFVNDVKDTVTKWAESHKNMILDYKSYRWNRFKTYEEAVKARNELEQAIDASRQMNNGGLDSDTLDRILKWGFPYNQDSPDDVPFRSMPKTEVLRITRQAFQFLDQSDCYQACKTLMKITWKVPHPAGATKILGLSNQRKFCIYDSRVGCAVNDLRKNGIKVIRCPSQDYVQYETAYDEWANDYQKLIWALEIVRDHFKEQGYERSISQLEMALFMMGKP